MSCTDKIKTLDELQHSLELVRDGKKIVHCHGVFDLLHIGHIRYLEQAKKLGDILVVTLTEDRYVNKGPHRPAFSGNLRAEALAALDSVDYVALNRWPTAVETIKALKPDFYVKGSDYRNSDNDLTGKIREEEKAVRSVGGKIHFTDEITFSSSSLLNQHFPQFSDEVNRYLEDLRSRHTAKEITAHIESLRDLNVLLVGETILDEYVYCDSLGKSGKEPMLAMKYRSSERYAGGCLAIANHLASFCNNVTLVSYLGAENTEEEFVRSNLKSNVRPVFIYKPASPTIVKRRFLDSYSLAKLLGVYEINGDLLNGHEDAELCGILEHELADVDLALVADYDHGLITSKMVNILSQRSPFLAINTQVNAANIGFHTISKYSHADFVCIHEGEIRLDQRKRNGDLKPMVLNLSERMNCKSVLITRGYSGSMFYRQNEGFTSSPSLAMNVKDRVGAGDSVLALASLMAVKQVPSDILGFIGNLAGAEAVSYLGNERSIEKIPLLKGVASFLK